MKFTSVAALIGLALTTIQPAVAQENYGSWNRHRHVYLNTSFTGAGMVGLVTDFPVLIRLGTADSAIFTQSRAGGADLRFTKADDATRLPHQIERWDSAGKSAAIWVRVDSVKGNTSTHRIRMHWGKSDAADSSNGAAVFSNGFANVWHLGDAAGTTARPNAVAGGNTAVPTNFPGGYGPVAGLIGRAEYLRGGNGYTSGNPTASLNNDYFNLGTNTTDYTNGITFSLWVNPETLGQNLAFYSTSETANGTATGGIMIVGLQGNESTSGAKFRQRNGTSGNNSGIIGTGGEMAGIAGGWHHILCTMDNFGEMVYYLDGNAVAFASGIAAFANTSRTVQQLGTSLAHMNYVDSSFRGNLDEARLANVPRSAEWAKLEFENQRAAQTLVVFDSIPVSLAGSAPSLNRAGFSSAVSGGSAHFRLAENRYGARLTVFDGRGRAVWKTNLAAGVRETVWEGQGTASGAAAPFGVYATRVSVLNARGGIETTFRSKLAFTR
jgi:hypothetical protein